jgi:hypothetical protein
VGVAEDDHKASVGKERRVGTAGVGVAAADKVRVVGERRAGNSLSIVAVSEEFGMAGARVDAEVQKVDANMG